MVDAKISFGWEMLYASVGSTTFTEGLQYGFRQIAKVGPDQNSWRKLLRCVLDKTNDSADTVAPMLYFVMDGNTVISFGITGEGSFE